MGGIPQRQSLAPLYVQNRRDGSRLLSSALVICTIGATQMHQHWGVLLTSISAVVCIYWGYAYSRLERWSSSDLFRF